MQDQTPKTSTPVVATAAKRSAKKTTSASSRAAARTRARASSVMNPFSIRQAKPKKVSVRITGSKNRALTIVAKFPDEFRPEFHAWIDSNWHIWQAFCGEAEVVWGSGRRRYSARTIVEFIRHETAMKELNGGYKINNSYVPDLGRLYGMMKKSRQTFFECRTMAHPIVRSVIRGPGKASKTMPTGMVAPSQAQGQFANF